MRVFIAVACPAALAAALDGVARRLPAARWRAVAPEARHMTLRFLGEQPSDLVDAAGRALAEVCRRTPAFTVQIRGVGAFPSARRPEVVWAGGGQEAERLSALAAALERDLVAAGIPPESRPFRAHITLARRRPGAAVALAAEDAAGLTAQYAQAPLGLLAVRAVTLFRSELHPAGARYTVVQQVALAPVGVDQVP